MTGPAFQLDDRLDRLVQGYWDGTLTAAEAAELDARLAADPAARDWVRTVCFQAAVTSEWAAAGRPVAEPVPRPTPKVSRRRLIAGFGLGTAVGLTGGLLAARLAVGRPPQAVRVVWSRGQVFAADGFDRPLTAGSVVPAGVSVVTVGTNSAAALECPDGSRLNLSADSAVAVDVAAGWVRLLRGALAADLKAAADPHPPLSLATAAAALTAGGGVELAISSTPDATELQVQHGRAAVTSPAGVRLGEATAGELFTVHADGRHRKQAVPLVPDRYALDLTAPWLAGWQVGTRADTPDGPVLRPAFWYDPYHSAVLSQIRSHNVWTRGLVRLYPDSELHVRYRADRPAFGEVVLVVRTPGCVRGATGNLQWDGTFRACLPGEWATLTARADALLDNRHTPEFGPPWVAFLLIFNTFDADIGLCVADVRVSRPGGS